MKELSREDKVGIFNKAAGNRTFEEMGDPLVQVTCYAEETVELFEAIHAYITSPTEELREKLVKEWADCQVTLSNIGWFFNIDGNVAFNRVNDNNMSKIGPDGKVIRRSDGKVLKPEGYENVSMAGL